MTGGWLNQKDFLFREETIKNELGAGHSVFLVDFGSCGTYMR